MTAATPCILLVAVVAVETLCAPPANAQVSKPEETLIRRRQTLDNVHSLVHTADELASEEFIDEYWINDECLRVDNYPTGDKGGLFYRGYSIPGEAVFFTNEPNQAGGRVLVEVRSDDKSVVTGDVRNIGLGIGAIRAPNSELLFVVGAHSNAPRAVNKVTEDGRECTSVSYQASGVEYSFLLDDQRGYEPIRIVTTYTGADGVEQNSTDIELQELSSRDLDAVYFPKRVTIKQSVEGKLKRHLVETVEKCELGAVSRDSFSLVALGVPIGHPVFDFRRPTREVGHWDGAQVSHAPELRPSASRGGSLNRALIFGNIAVLLLLAGLAIVAWRWRRKRTETPS